MATSLAAANAYAALADIGMNSKSKAPGLELGDEMQVGGPKFGALVEESIGGFIQQGQLMEKTALQSTIGKANIVDMVTAVSEAEMQLSTLTALRDKVIDAYEKTMNMPV